MAEELPYSCTRTEEECDAVWRERQTLLSRVKVLTAERDDYILKQKVWEQANDELRSENIRLNRATQSDAEGDA